MRNLEVRTDRFPIAGQFTIARGSKTEAVVVVCEISENGFTGRGECVPYGRYNETVDSVTAQIKEMKIEIEKGCTREQLQNKMPAGAARNAIDCALWDLEAKAKGRRVYELLGCTKLKQVETAYTISLGTPEAMFESAKHQSKRPLLKIKMGSAEGDIERIHAVRRAAPHAKLIADANEGWTRLNIEKHMEACKNEGFALVEQPIPAADDEILRELTKIVPICADESVHGVESLNRLVGLYEYVNIKLDKTGGLTEALALSAVARQKGFGIMVGCMVSSSLAMAPAMILAQQAEFVDLDGPLLLAVDRENGLHFEGSTIYPPELNLWG